MKRYAMLASVVAVGGAVAFQGTYVNLQGSTPGTPQSGHSNITGTAKSNSVVAYNSTPTGQTFGGDFRVTSSQGRGILGNASSPTGATYGGLFQAWSNGGRGIAGIAAATNGTTYGGFFSSLSNQGRGVYGQATSSSGLTYGVYGKTSSPSGYGVYSEGNMHATGVISGNGSGLTNVTATNLVLPVYITTASSNAFTIVNNQALGITYDASSSGGSATGYRASMSGNGGNGFVASVSGSGGIGVIANSSGSNGIGGYFFGNLQGVVGNGPTGVKGESSSGTGVRGEVASNVGTSYGVYGSSPSPDGYGVYSEGRFHSTGIMSGNAGNLTNLKAENIAPIGNLTLVATTGGAAMYGIFSGAGVGRGVIGETGSTLGTGVLGYAHASTGNTIGVKGQADSSTGYGGVFSGAGPDALYVSNFGSGRGIIATSVTDTGIWGNTTSGLAGVDGRNATSNNYAVYGLNTANSGNSYGTVGATGYLGGFGVFAFGVLGASGPKPFRIDYPTDPENKYLLHYSAESPFPQNFYSGNVKTDATGYAWVELPEYFADVNTNFKYQLTILDDEDGGDFVMAKVSKKIRDNRFQIRTSVPNMEVSWRVEADRNDLYVRHSQPKDIVLKQGSEKGTYQHPELYGLSADRGVLARGNVAIKAPADLRPSPGKRAN